jgi:glycosyltransferase involved in cell wall biosynthesis
MLGQSAGVVIPWKDRKEFATSLSRNAAIFREHNFEVIVVNCGGDAQSLEEILHKIDVPISVIEVEETSFNRSLALNVGAYYSHAEVLLLLDCDILLHRTSLLDSLSRMESGRVVTIARVRETLAEPWEGARIGNGNIQEVIVSHSSLLVWSDGRTTPVTNRCFYASDGSRAGQGQLLVRRSDLLAVEGYNSQLDGWGFEDIDILIRLQRVLSLRHLEVGEALHISHGDRVRNINRGSRFSNNKYNCDLAYSNYSKGDFNGSLLQDVERWREVTGTLQLFGRRLVLREREKIRSRESVAGV